MKTNLDLDRAESFFRALKVYKKRLVGFDEILIPGAAWIGMGWAIIWVWSVLDSHRLVWIVSAHILFRILGRMYMNLVWMPRVIAELSKRFPEWADEMQKTWEDLDV